MSFKLWLESNQILYHHASRENRESIRRFGLLTKYDQTMVDSGDPNVSRGIYLTNKPDFSNKWIDVWEVDVRGMDLQDDWTTTPEDPYEKWHVVYQDIPPAKLKLKLLPV